MKALLLTSLFANNMQPTHGIFNQQQFSRLGRKIDLKVVSPVPWYPPGMKGDKAIYRKVVQHEQILGLSVHHPRYVVIPKIGRFTHGWAYWMGVRQTVKEIHEKFPFDAIIACWAYPDAYAGYLLSQEFKVPLFVKVHGSDINILAEMYNLRPFIKTALTNATAVMANTQDLCNKIAALGVEEKNIQYLPNGVDKFIFFQQDKNQLQRALGLNDKEEHIVFIGNLVEVKGVEYLIDAFSLLDHQTKLHIIGDGPLREHFLTKVDELKMKDRVFFHGKKPHHEIPQWMNAADVFCLPSLNEGCPNVVLEALSCGTPVVATSVGGSSEIVKDGENGFLVPKQNPTQLTQGIQQALEKKWDADLITESVADFDWDKGVTTLTKLIQDSVVRYRFELEI